MPYEEAKKRGILGFFRGIYMGLISIIIKPTIAMYDLLISIIEVIHYYIHNIYI